MWEWHKSSASKDRYSSTKYFLNICRLPLQNNKTIICNGNLTVQPVSNVSLKKKKKKKPLPENISICLAYISQSLRMNSMSWQASHTGAPICYHIYYRYTVYSHVLRVGEWVKNKHLYVSQLLMLENFRPVTLWLQQKQYIYQYQLSIGLRLIADSISLLNVGFLFTFKVALNA